jgi:hypothetical protein
MIQPRLDLRICYCLNGPVHEFQANLFKILKASHVHECVASGIYDVNQGYRCILVKKSIESKFVSVLYNLEGFLADLLDLVLV